MPWPGWWGGQGDNSLSWGWIVVFLFIHTCEWTPILLISKGICPAENSFSLRPPPPPNKNSCWSWLGQIVPWWLPKAQNSRCQCYWWNNNHIHMYIIILIAITSFGSYVIWASSVFLTPFHLCLSFSTHVPYTHVQLSCIHLYSVLCSLMLICLQKD